MKAEDLLPSDGDMQADWDREHALTLIDQAWQGHAGDFKSCMLPIDDVCMFEATKGHPCGMPIAWVSTMFDDHELRALALCGHHGILMEAAIAMWREINGHPVETESP